MNNFYNLLTKFYYVSTAKYRFVTEADVVITLPNYKFGYASYYSEDKVLRMVCAGDTIIITKGYAWDGCSPKFSVGGKWVGTPDFDGTILASLVHDALYQFMAVPCFKLKREDADGIFGGIMKQNDFTLAPIYYRAVRIFGGVFEKLSFKNPKPYCKAD